MAFLNNFTAPAWRNNLYSLLHLPSSRMEQGNGVRVEEEQMSAWDFLLFSKQTSPLRLPVCCCYCCCCFVLFFAYTDFIDPFFKVSFSLFVYKLIFSLIYIHKCTGREGIKDICAHLELYVSFTYIYTYMCTYICICTHFQFCQVKCLEETIPR